jgi:Ankyrin repeats (many copies)
MDRNDSPILYWAINFSSLDVINMLYTYGADPDLFCGSGRRPIFKAAYLDREDVLEWLLKIPRAK